MPRARASTWIAIYFLAGKTTAWALTVSWPALHDVNATRAFLSAHNTCVPDASARGEPRVQCWREPYCVSHDYLDAGRCSAWVRDAGTLLSDPVLARDPSWVSICDDVAKYLRNKTLVFMGDSINSQVFTGLLCEAHRCGARVSYGAVTARHARRLLAVNPDDWHGPPPSRAALLTATDTLFLAKGWGRYYERDFRATLQVANVLVFNFGLHYHDDEMETYRAHMASAVSAAKSASAAAIFRETSSQSFPGDAGGTFVSQQGLTAGEKDWSYPCVASDGASGLGERQNAEVKAIISKGGRRGGRSARHSISRADRGPTAAHDGAHVPV